MCRICLSEYRQEIDDLAQKKILLTAIKEVYYPLLKEQYTEHGFYSALRNHINKKHFIQMKALDKAKERSVPDNSPKTIEEYAQKTLEMGFTPEMLNKVNPQIILQAQKILIEKDKAKAQNDFLKLAMQKMMSGLITPGDIEEGEILDDPIRAISGLISSNSES